MDAGTIFGWFGLLLFGVAMLDWMFDFIPDCSPKAAPQPEPVVDDDDGFVAPSAGYLRRHVRDYQRAHLYANNWHPDDSR